MGAQRLVVRPRLAKARWHGFSRYPRRAGPGVTSLASVWSSQQRRERRPVVPELRPRRRISLYERRHGHAGCGLLVHGEVAQQDPLAVEHQGPEVDRHLDGRDGEREVCMPPAQALEFLRPTPLEGEVLLTEVL